MGGMGFTGSEGYKFIVDILPMKTLQLQLVYKPRCGGGLCKREGVLLIRGLKGQ